MNNGTETKNGTERNGTHLDISVLAEHLKERNEQNKQGTAAVLNVLNRVSGLLERLEKVGEFETALEKTCKAFPKK